MIFLLFLAVIGFGWMMLLLWAAATKKSDAAKMDRYIKARLAAGTHVIVGDRLVQVQVVRKVEK